MRLNQEYIDFIPGLTNALEDAKNGAFDASGDAGMGAYNRSLLLTPPAIDEVVTAEEELKIAAQEAKEAQDNLKSSLDDLNSFVAGPLREENENYEEKLGDLKDKYAEMGVKIDETKAKILELSAKGKDTAEQRTALGELDTDYKNLAQEIVQTGVEHELATKKILFGIMTQRAAMDGLSGSEVDALGKIATKWGLVDQATLTSTANIDLAWKNLASGGSGINQTVGILTNVDSIIRNIPTRVEINVHTTYTEFGAPLPGNPKGIPQPRAGGGPVGAGDYWVGEQGMEGLHLNPGSSGYVISNQQFGNVSMNFSSPVANGEQLYKEFKRRLLDDMRAERLRA